MAAGTQNVDAGREEAEQRLASALAEQARLTERYAESAGTTGEMSAYWRLRDAARAVRRCERLLADVGVSGPRFAFSLLAGLTAPGEARAEIGRRLSGNLDGAVMRIVSLLASETVTNAVKYGAVASVPTVDIAGDLTSERLRVEVTNAGEAFECDADLPSADEPDGRGLFLVDALARAWGTEHAGGTTTVWFEIDCCPN